MTKAEEFKERATNARTKSNAERQYERLIKEIEDAVDEGKAAFPLRKFTQEGIKYAHQGIRLSDEDAKQLYDEQEQLYDCFRKNGFVVREEDVEMPSTLDISMPEQVRQQIEMTKRMIEKDVYIIWDVEEFDSDKESNSGLVLN